MALENKPPRQERERTDESLRTERAKTDDELATRLTGIEADAAGVIENARNDAAVAVRTARQVVDHELERPAQGGPAHVKMVEARAREDAATAHEHAAADDKLEREREERLQALLRLLPIEREKTDLFLLTERARSDEAVATRDDFLSIVSHDLRGLLNTVSLGAQLIEHDVARRTDGDATAEAARRIKRAAARMTRLIADLVDVSSLESGKLGITRVRGDVTALVAEALDTFGPTAAAKGISLGSDRLEPSLVASFDHDRILQVLANLIGNAIKFTPSGGAIRVSAARAGGAVQLSVRDNGPGIAKAQTDAVFERFWQLGANDKRGLGLGLFIAKGIVDAHGGRIWVESELGAGSTFHFTVATAATRGVAAAEPLGQVP